MDYLQIESSRSVALKPLLIASFLHVGEYWTINRSEMSGCAINCKFGDLRAIVIDNNAFYQYISAIAT